MEKIKLFSLQEKREKNRTCSNSVFGLYCISIKRAQRVKLILCEK